MAWLLIELGAVADRRCSATGYLAGNSIVRHKRDAVM
jgi:hypothetical protein